MIGWLTGRIALVAAVTFAVGYVMWPKKPSLIGLENNFHLVTSPAGIGDLEQAARQTCADRGLTLRALVLLYDEFETPVGARAYCGGPGKVRA